MTWRMRSAWSEMVRRFNSLRRPSSTRPRRRPFITAVHRLSFSSAPVTNTTLNPSLAGLAASDKLAVTTKSRRWRPWAWAAAALLHAAVIAALLLLLHHRPLPEQDSPPGIAVVFDNGGAAQTAAPPVPRQGPTQEAAAPPPASPPPPPAAQQPEVNLNTPPMPFADLQSLPQPAPPQPAPLRPAPRPPAPQKYVMMDGMSYGSPAPQAPPAPPMPGAKPALSLSLPQSDAEAANAPELTIKGHIGADWQAALNKWVNDHKYYPQAAAEQGQQGSVQVEFTVDRTGNVTAVHLLDSSGSTFLDQAWYQLFAQNQLPPFPSGTKADHITVDATMHFELIQ